MDIYANILHGRFTIEVKECDDILLFIPNHALVVERLLFIFTFLS